MIKAPTNLQELRRKIYVKAKAESQWRFWGLYVHVCKMETLREAYRQAKRNAGAPGIDNLSFEDIETQGSESYLEGIRGELVDRSYRPQRTRKVSIPKTSGKGTRTLKIPTIRDRIVQGAIKLILEPIFEADFQDGSYGYRPKRSAEAAVNRTARAILNGKTRVIDCDIKSYFDAVPHNKLLSRIASRVQDKDIMHLLKLILKSSGKRGLPQGGSLSPLLSNVYLNQIDKMLEKAKQVTATNGYNNLEYVRWADDLVILIDGYNKHARLIDIVMKRLKEEFAKLELEMSQEKTKQIDLSQARAKLEYIGFVFRLTKRDGKSLVIRHPKRKSLINLQRSIKKIFWRKRGRAVREAVALINPKIRGWVNYFRHGNSSRHFKILKDWYEKKVRRHLLKQKQQRGFGWKRWSRKVLYQRYGLYNDYKIIYSVLPKVKPAQ